MDKRRQRIIYILSDIFMAALAWLLFNLLRYYEVAHYQFGSLTDYLLFYQVLKGQILIPLFWLILYYFSGYYNKPFGKSRVNELFSTFITISIGSVLIFFIVVLDDLPESFQVYYDLLFALWGIQFFLTYLSRAFITNYSLRKVRRHEWFENVLIVGTGENATKMCDNLDKLGYNVVGCVGVVDDTFKESDDIENIIKQHKVDQIFVAVNSNDVVPTLYKLYKYRLPVKVMVDKNNFLSKARINTIQGIPVVDITENNFSEAEKNIKLFMDKVISLCVLIILSPMYLYISLRVKAESKGSVFFRQERIGYRGKPFTIYKFRTMYDGASSKGPLLTMVDDDRVTPFGRFLRKYRIDEFPQFWNVLKGDMSIVGPRPEQRYYIEQIVQKAPYYYLLHNVRPGITSLGMVKFGYAETVDKMIDRLAFDIIYYENMSIVLDIKILIYTVKIVFTGKGV